MLQGVLTFNHLAKHKFRSNLELLDEVVND
jgi:hypothetical protein